MVVVKKTNRYSKGAKGVGYSYSPKGVITNTCTNTESAYLREKRNNLFCLEKQLPGFFLVIKSDLFTSPCILPMLDIIAFNSRLREGQLQYESGCHNISSSSGVSGCPPKSPLLARDRAVCIAARRRPSSATTANIKPICLVH